MNNNQLYIPKKINVGYQKREDTYTKKLAYVIYYDDKNVLRKEQSWNSWRDKSIKNTEFENVPTEGFVLNKGVGGARHSYGWNARNEYIRIYDPRDFEFEISVANLLFILRETDCMKGKGLVGEFVYSWDGKDLVLLPVISEEYKKSQEYTKLQKQKIGVKDLTPGCVYTTKKQEKLIYIGKYNWLSREYDYRNKDVYKYIKCSPKYIFFDVKNSQSEIWDYGYKPLSGLTSLATKDTDVAVTDYAKLLDNFLKSKRGSLPKDIEAVAVELSVPVLNKGYFTVFECINGKYFEVSIHPNTSWIGGEYRYDGYRISKSGYCISNTDGVKFLKRGEDRSYSSSRTYKFEELMSRDYYNIYIVLESGKKVKYEKYL